MKKGKETYIIKTVQKEQKHETRSENETKKPPTLTPDVIVDDMADVIVDDDTPTRNQIK